MQKVYQAICAVQQALSIDGIVKDRKNQQQGYSFRGIDDVYNALAPLLAKNSLCILPRYLSRTVSEKVTKSGGVLFYVIVDGEFDFVSAEDGSKHTVKMYGEAMDSADKATNKAASAAYKYACLQTFCIPTEGDNDADAHTHDVKADAIPMEWPAEKKLEVVKKEQVKPVGSPLVSKRRDRMLEILFENGFESKTILDFALTVGILSEKQDLLDWPDSHVPKTQAEMDALVAKFKGGVSPIGDTKAPDENDWREFACPPFGDLKGKKLGDLEEKDLAYWIGKYEVAVLDKNDKPRNPKWIANDRLFRAALDEANSELNLVP